MFMLPHVDLIHIVQSSKAISGQHLMQIIITDEKLQKACPLLQSQLSPPCCTIYSIPPIHLELLSLLYVCDPTSSLCMRPILFSMCAAHPLLYLCDSSSSLCARPVLFTMCTACPGCCDNQSRDVCDYQHSCYCHMQPGDHNPAGCPKIPLPMGRTTIQAESQ